MIKRQRVIIHAFIICFVFFVSINIVKAEEPEYLWHSATSTIARFYSLSGDGTVGIGNDRSTTSWDYYHNAISGDIVSYIDSVGIAGIKYWSWGLETPQIYRGFLPIDTSLIPEDSNIISAKLNIYLTTINHTDEDGNDFLGIVNTFQNSSLVLNEIDYSKCGYVHNANEGASRVFFNDLLLNKFNTWILNTTGMNWISKGGITYLGLREGHDILDDPLDLLEPNQGTNRIDFITSEDVAITKRPYLEVRYSTIPEKKSPIIIVPGIVGSWYSSKYGWQMDPILHTYDDLMTALRGAGYKDGEDLFAFPYDWRQTNVYSAYQLKEKIDEVKLAASSNKVDLVAHSMGGLVARQYIESEDYDNDVGRIVFLGTPQQGAPQAYRYWEAGEGFDGFSDKVLKEIIEYQADTAGYDTLLDYIHTGIVSISQLLPTYEYLLDSSGMRVYDPVNQPENYPYNNWLWGLNTGANLDRLTSGAIGVYSLVGDYPGNTITQFEVGEADPAATVWPHGEVAGIFHGAGDGTVPRQSSSLFDSEVVPGAAHRLLPTEAQIRVIEYLTGTAPAATVDEMQLAENLMFARVYSPVDFVITAPDGRKVGRDPAAPDEVNEIPYAFYSGFENDNEYATLLNPAAGVYRIDLLGTGSGIYKLAVDILAAGSCGESGNSVSGVIANGEIRTYEASLSYDAGGCPLLDLAVLPAPADPSGDIDSLCRAGEISKKAACNFFTAKFRWFKLQFAVYDKIRCGLLKKLAAKSILLQIKLVEEKVKFYENKGWLTAAASGILMDDLEGLKAKIK